MSKSIEILTVTDPEAMKQQLEHMVNRGWQIKGVGCNPNNGNTDEQFVILERDSADDPTVNEELYENEEPTEEIYTKPEPPRKEISISMGE